MKIYFISGLAADSRVFKNIRVPAGYDVIHLDWITPIKNESLKDYAIRLGTVIDKSEPFAIVGLSLGGMIATELALHYKPKITILISSVPLAKQLPFYFRMAGKLGIHKLLPVSIIKSATILKHLFSAETKEDKHILYQVLRESDPAFIRWAMNAVVNWKNEQLPHPYIHIHGSTDKVLPIGYTNPTHVLKGAGHLLVMNRAPEVNEILKEYLVENSYSFLVN